MYFSKTHFELGNPTQNRCMNILVVLSPADFVVVLSEVYARILLNIFYSSSNDKLKIPGKYKGMDSIERHALFLDYCVKFVRKFYFENICPLIKSTAFSYMFYNFEINYDYSGENFKTVNDSYLQYCKKTFD